MASEMVLVEVPHMGIIQRSFVAISYRETMIRSLTGAGDICLD